MLRLPINLCLTSRKGKRLVTPACAMCPGYWAVFQSTMGISGEAIWAKLARCVPVRGVNGSTAAAPQWQASQQRQQQEEHRKRRRRRLLARSP